VLLLPNTVLMLEPRPQLLRFRLLLTQFTLPNWRMFWMTDWLCPSKHSILLLEI